MALLAHGRVSARRLLAHERRGDAVALAFLAAVVLAILWPVLAKPGYVLLLDWAWTPAGMMFQPTHHFPAWEAWGSGDYPLNAVPLQGALRLLGVAVPQPLLQRAFLLALFGGMAGAGWLLAPTQNRAARAYCALIVVVNPFVYARFVAGQWFALAAAAVLPLALAALLRALRHGGRRSVLLAGAAAGALGIADAHTFYLFVFAAPLVALAFAVADRRRARTYAGRGAAVLGVTALLSAYWTLPALRDGGLIDAIDRSDLAYFATRPDATFGLLFNTASMHGFWAESAPTKDALRLWWLLFVPIGGLAAAGLVCALRGSTARGEAMAMALAGAAALLFAMGPEFPPSSGAFLWAFDHVPGMRGLREPQRAAVFLPPVYGYLGAIAVARAGAALPARGAYRLSAAAWALPLYGAVALYSFRLFWGAAGAVVPVEFPASWYEAREIVAAHPESAMLVLPWHKFTPLPFTERRVIHPAPSFFGGGALVADDEERPVGGARSLDGRLRYVDALLERRDEIDSFGNLVSVLGVRYVFIVASADYRRDVDFLDRQRDVRLLRRWPDAYLYENERHATLFYASSATRTVANIDALIALARSTALTDYVWTVDDAAAGRADGAGKRHTGHPTVSRSGPASFEVIDPGGAFLQVAAVSPARPWRLEGREPLPTLLPVLAYPGTAGTLSTPVVREFAPGYALSALAAVAAVATPLAERARERRARRRGRRAPARAVATPRRRGVGSRPPA